MSKSQMSEPSSITTSFTITEFNRDALIKAGLLVKKIKPQSFRRPSNQRKKGKKMKVLDVCCGGKMMWANKQDERCLFLDKRKETQYFTDNGKQRALEINPDLQADFTRLPFQDNSFYLVVFDPPHLIRAGQQSWLAKKYGKLGQQWQDDIKQGFSECFRVLKPNGTLIFKWNEDQIKVSEILKLTGHKPLFGHVTGRNGKTHLFTFMKPDL